MTITGWIQGAVAAFFGEQAGPDEKARELVQNRWYADALINKARGEHQKTRGVIPHIDRLGAFRNLFTPADGLAFYDGRHETLVNAWWSSPREADARAAMLGTWSERDGVIAVVDTMGRMYIGASSYKGQDGRAHLLGPVLESHHFYRGDWTVPIAGKDVPYGRVNYRAFVRPRPVLGLHRHVQGILGRKAYERPGQLERFIHNAEPPPGVRRGPVIIDANVFANF